MDQTLEKMNDLIKYVNYRIGEVTEEERVELTYLLISVFLLKSSYENKMLHTTIPNFTLQYSVMVSKLSELIREQTGTLTPDQDKEFGNYLKNEFPDLFSLN